MPRQIRGLQEPRSLGDLQDLIHEGTVPYFWPYFEAISPYIGLKNRPKIYGASVPPIYDGGISMDERQKVNLGHPGPRHLGYIF
jgi:hypothetical protein